MLLCSRRCFYIPSSLSQFTEAMPSFCLEMIYFLAGRKLLVSIPIAANATWSRDSFVEIAYSWGIYWYSRVRADHTNTFKKIRHYILNTIFENPILFFKEIKKVWEKYCGVRKYWRWNDLAWIKVIEVSFYFHPLPSSVTCNPYDY